MSIRCPDVGIPSLLVWAAAILVLQSALLVRMLPEVVRVGDIADAPPPLQLQQHYTVKVGAHYDREQSWWLSGNDPLEQVLSNPNRTHDETMWYDERGEAAAAATATDPVKTTVWRNTASRRTSRRPTTKHVFHDRHVPTNHQHHPSYPRWGGEPPKASIDWDALLRHIQNQLLAQTWHFPETLYVVRNATQLWVSRTLRRAQVGVLARDRMDPLESLYYDALQHLSSSSSSSSVTQYETSGDRWKALRVAVQRDEGIPFVALYRDYTGCGGQTRQQLVHGNNNDSLSMLPIFTLCATVLPDCDYAFPVPTYFMIKTARDNWRSVMHEQEERQPFHRKHKKAVWRGAFTGRSWNHGRSNQRSTMYHLSKNHTELLDVQQATKGPPHAEHFLPMEQFRNYRAVIDLDGDAWSKRFVGLLCYNSVVLKVQPAYVDYFHPELRPWKHYIPVKADLSDLAEKAAYAVSDDNRDDVQRIIRSAQDWCAQRVTKPRLVEDMLDIWNSYVEFLNRGNTEWQHEWRSVTEEIYSSGFDMARVRSGGTIHFEGESGVAEWTRLQFTKHK